MEIIVPGIPVSVNHAFLTTSSGRRILNDAGRAYREVAGWETRAAVLRDGWRWSGSWLRLTIKIYRPNNRRFDTHNQTKVLLDGLADGLDVDDKWYLVHEEIPEIDKANPRAVITIEQEA